MAINSSNTNKAIQFAALTALGLAGNFLRFPIFFSIDFLFGSIFSMLALQMLGTRWGVISALLVSSCTFLFWNHPYAIIIFTAEAGAVAWLTSRKRVELVTADVVFWIIIGMPLVFLFYFFVMRLPITNATVTMLKQAVNGIFNALIARLIFFAVSYRMGQLRFSMREIISNSLFLFVLLPSIGFIGTQSRKDRDDLDRNIRESLIVTAKKAAANLENWLQSREHKVAYLAQLAAKEQLPLMQRAVEQLKAEEDDFLRVGLLDKSATIVAYSELVDELGKPNIGKNFADRPFISTMKQTLKPMLSEVVMGKIGIPRPVVPVLAPVVVNGIYNGYATGILNLQGVDRLLAINTQAALASNLRYTLRDKNGNVIVSNDPMLKTMKPFKRASGDVIQVSDQLSQWLPASKSQISVSDRWKEAVYIHESNVGASSGWKLNLDLPVQPFQLNLYGEYSWILLRLLIVLLVGLTFARLLSKKICSSLNELEVITLNLPSRLSKLERINWGQSYVEEIQLLINNFSGMANVLAQKFSEIGEINDGLERDIALRTKELNNESLRLGTLLEMASDGIHILDEYGNLMQSSQSFLHSIGYDKQEAANLNVRDWEAYIPNEQLVETVHRLILKGDTFQTQHRHKSGVIFDVEINAKGIELDGKAYLYASSRDITERTLAEKALLKSKVFLQTLIDAAPVGISVSAPDGQLIMTNNRSREILGLPDDEQLRRNIAGPQWKIVRPDGTPMPLEEFASVRAQQEHLPIAGIEMGIVREDGIRWISVDAVPSPDSNYGVIVAYSDISQRKAAERLLADSEQHLKALIEATPVGVFETDNDGKCIFVNQLWSEITGLSVDQALGEGWSATLHPDDRTLVYQEWMNASAERRTFSLQYRFVQPNGKTTWVLGRSRQLVSTAGELIGYIGTITDITLNKQFEEQLATAKDEAEAANLAKSRFLATMSHEIRTPMNGVLGMAQMLLLPDLTESQRVVYARRIISSGHSLLTLLNDILDLSRIEAGKFQLESSVLDPAAVLQETVTLFSASSSTKQLKLDHQWHGPLHQRYKCDSQRVGQMLANLVGNAIKFTPEGSVTLEGREIEREGETALLECSVSDTGIGIAPDQLDLLFKPFSQADSSTTRKFGGTGLGLSIVYSMAKAMGGEVGVQSVEGKGSRFWFRVSAQVVAEGHASVDLNRSTQPDTASATVFPKLSGHALIVEDNPDSCQLIELFLATVGVTFDSAKNGQLAVNAIKQGACPNIVLMDLHLPVMGGMAATELIRKFETQSGRARAPIIALTADAFEEVRQKCIGAGMDDFLTKPIQLDVLYRILAHWLPRVSEERTDSASVSTISKQIDSSEFASQVAELIPLLEQNKFNAMASFRRLQSLVAGTDLANDFHVMNTLMGALRFDQVLERLRPLAATYMEQGSS